MALRGSKWLQITPKGLKTAQNSSKWPQMASNGSKWLNISPNGFKWLQMDPNGPKWLQIALNRSKFPFRPWLEPLCSCFFCHRIFFIWQKLVLSNILFWGKSFHEKWGAWSVPTTQLAMSSYLYQPLNWPCHPICKNQSTGFVILSVLTTQRAMISYL